MNLPNLKDARVRGKHKVEVKREDYVIPEAVRNIGENKKYCILTYGCQMNVHDSENIAAIMEDMQYRKTDDMQDADIIVINTCAIRENAHNKVMGNLGRIKHLKEKKDIITVFCGCMAQEEGISKELTSKYKWIDIIMGTHNIHKLPIYLEEIMKNKKQEVNVYSIEGDVYEGIPVKRDSKYKAWVNIMYGCDKFCTYCIVPYTRGKQRSRLMEDILEEIEELKREGYQEVCLLGQNVNAYGKDLGMEDGFAKLLEEVAKTNIPRIRFSTSHPRDFSENMVHVMKKYTNIMPSLHLPVQSGNNDILKIMGRGYTVEHYKHLYDLLKQEIPNITFSTDIIVGFPNETHEQFLDTLALVDYCKYDLAYTFIYSPRESTPAAKMVDNVPEEEKSKRLQMLNEKITYYSNLNNQKYLHKTLKVLVDGLSKKNKEVYSGYSEENKLVNFTGKNVEVGKIVEVYITEIKSYSLNGIVKEETDEQS